MTCADFFLSYCDGIEWDSLCDEMYWGDSYSSDLCLEWLKRRAEQEEIKLTDLDDWDYDRFFYQTYRDTEKGLS